MSRYAFENDILQILHTLIGPREITTETVLLGREGILNSITAVQFISHVERELKIEFEDDIIIEALSDIKSLLILIDQMSRST